MTFPVRFSEAFEGTGAELLEAVDRLGLEGIVSKRLTSRYRSRRSDAWLKVKCFMTSRQEVIGLERLKEGAVTALLADRVGGTPHYVGRAFVSLGGRERKRFCRRLEGMTADRPPPGEQTRAKAAWLKPGLSVRVRHLKGEDTLRHASLIGIEPKP